MGTTAGTGITAFHRPGNLKTNSLAAEMIPGSIGCGAFRVPVPWKGCDAVQLLPYGEIETGTAGD